MGSPDAIGGKTGLKIVMVSGSLPDLRCGIGDYTARLVTELARSPGVSIFVVTSKTERVRADAAAPAVVLRAPGWGLRNLLQLVRMIRLHAPDIVHIQYPAIGYGRALGIVVLPLAVRWLCGVPAVLTIHERRERRLIARLAINFMALTSNLVLTLDPVEASSLQRALRPFRPRILTGAMISTIPVVAGVDRQAWRKRWGASAADVVVVTFGLIHPRRRIEDIIDATDELRRSRTTVRLWVVGGEAEYDPDAARAYGVFLRDRARSRGLDAAIQWMDHVDRAAVSASLQAADVSVFLYPDGASGRNTTLQAAREHGLPVVTTVGPATSDSLRRQPRIVFLRAGDYTVADLAKAILQARHLEATDEQSLNDTLNLREHVDLHLGAYRDLLPGQLPDRGKDASLEIRPK